MKNKHNTLDTLYENLIELKKIALEETVSGNSASKLLLKDPTTHNIELVRNFIEQHSRNR